ncbi:MAG: PD40 domain-containing protein [Demequinaceae bacterium]|nr:PD40 domain-containing protein [Demequinaceae bacterium]
MISRVASLALAAAFVLTLAACEPEEDPTDWAWADAPNPRVLFVSRASDPHGNGEMYLLTKEGEIIPVLDGTSVNANPSITRDGTRVAFHRVVTPDDFSSTELFMVDLATGTETRLTTDEFATAIPKWNADGTELVYSSWRTYDTPSEANVFVLDLEDWSVTQVTSEPEYEDNDPSWCGDDAIAFKSNRGTGVKYQEQIYLMDLDGSDVRLLSTTTGWESDHDPRCSPDGEWVYFYRYEATRAWTEFTAETWDEVYPVNVWRVNRDGVQEKLTDCEFFCAGPIPGDDGSVLYLEKEFIVDDDGVLIGSSGRLMIMDADGSNPRELLPPIVYAEHVSTIEWFDW